MTRIGVLLTSDNAIDPELWRYCPPDVSLHITRLYDWGEGAEDCTDSSRVPSDPMVIGPAIKSMDLIDPDATLFACTSGSFIDGVSGEQSLRAAMSAAGARNPVTTSGAVRQAMEALGIRRVGVGTPYDERCSRLLQSYLEEFGVSVASLVWAPPGDGRELVDITHDQVATLAREAYRPDVDAVFLSCTALETFDLIEPLSKELGVVVLTSVQASMWATLSAAGAPMPDNTHPLFSLSPVELTPA